MLASITGLEYYHLSLLGQRKMLSDSIWWSALALEALLLIRGWKCGLLHRYPIFYGYVFFVLIQSVLRFAISQWNAEAYRYAYWTTAYLAALAGSPVLFAIYPITLSRYPEPPPPPPTLSLFF